MLNYNYTITIILKTWKYVKQKRLFKWPTTTHHFVISLPYLEVCGFECPVSDGAFAVVLEVRSLMWQSFCSCVLRFFCTVRFPINTTTDGDFKMFSSVWMRNELNFCDNFVHYPVWTHNNSSSAMFLIKNCTNLVAVTPLRCNACHMHWSVQLLWVIIRDSKISTKKKCMW